jgi:hypothetical protein
VFTVGGVVQPAIRIFSDQSFALHLETRIL